MAVHSHSSLSLFEQCPRQYFYRYVARIETPVDMETIECFLGTRLHEALEHLYREHRKGCVLSLPNLVRYYRRTWHRHWRETIDLRGGGEPATWLALGDRCLARYYRTHQPFRDAETVSVETRLEFPLGEATGAPAHLMIGYADRIARRPSKTGPATWEVHDYKSGKWNPSQDELDDDRQLAIYEIGLRRAYPDIGHVELVWHLLESGREARSTRTAEQLAHLRRHLLELITDIEARGEDEGNFPTRRGWQCDFCAYRGRCPEWADDPEARDV